MSSKRPNDSYRAYDRLAKKVLAAKAILARIVGRVVAEYDGVSVKDIETKYIEGTPYCGEREATSVPAQLMRTTSTIQGSKTEFINEYGAASDYDIFFHAVAPSSGESIPLFINLEAQKDLPTHYPLIH